MRCGISGACSSFFSFATARIHVVGSHYSNSVIIIACVVIQIRLRYFQIAINVDWILQQQIKSAALTLLLLSISFNWFN